MGVRHYTDLVARQTPCDLVMRIHEATKEFSREAAPWSDEPASSSAGSVPPNIAERQRHAASDFHRCQSIAYTSLRQVETQLNIARRLGYFGGEVSGWIIWPDE